MAVLQTARLIELCSALTDDVISLCMLLRHLIGDAECCGAGSCLARMRDRSSALRNAKVTA